MPSPPGADRRVRQPPGPGTRPYRHEAGTGHPGPEHSQEEPPKRVRARGPTRNRGTGKDDAVRQYL